MSRVSFPGSTALSSMDYEPGTKTLTITFRNGRSYTYRDVPKDVAEQLQYADSPGTFWRESIKDAYS